VFYDSGLLILSERKFLGEAQAFSIIKIVLVYTVHGSLFYKIGSV
jgi:hypothetical protein